MRNKHLLKYPIKNTCVGPPGHLSKQIDGFREGFAELRDRLIGMGENGGSGCAEAKPCVHGFQRGTAQSQWTCLTGLGPSRELKALPWSSSTRPDPPPNDLPWPRGASTTEPNPCGPTVRDG